MKIHVIFKLTVLIFLCSILISAGSMPLSEAGYIQTEQNLLAGISSNNEGLISSSAYFLGEIKSEKAVIPLLRILKSSENEDLRLMAALSLFKIGDSRGIFAIHQASKFDDSRRVRKICGNFYNEFLAKNNS